MKEGEGCHPVMGDIHPVKGLDRAVRTGDVQTVPHNHTVIHKHNREKFCQIINLFQ